MNGLLGYLRGLKGGFMVAFVASERKKIEKFELAVHLCFLQQKRLFEETIGECTCSEVSSLLDIS